VTGWRGTGWRGALADGALWAGLCVLLPLNGEGLSEPGYRLWLVCAAIVAGVAVGVWRWAPLVALALAIGLVAADLWLAGPLVVLAFLVGRYAETPRPALWTFAAVTGVGAVLAGAVSTDHWVGFYVLAEVLFGGVFPWLVGRYRRQHRALVVGGWERAEQLERAQTVAVEQARLRERARIAQDMHDILGHELSLLALRAGALELDTTLDDRQRATAGELRAGAGTATERLRGIVGVLGAAAAAPLRPFDESVTDLVEGFRAAGLRVELEASAVGGLAPLADRAVYRVVQEGLTNAARHAPGAVVTLRVSGSASDIDLTVSNQVSEPIGPAGSGLVGLAERIRLAGGSFGAGVEDGPRFVVRASVPRLYAPQILDARQTPVSASSDTGEGPTVPGLRARAHHRTRRDLALTVLVPALAGVILVSVVFASYAVQILGSVLTPARAARLQVGSSESVVDKSLPPLQVGERPDVVAPPIPAGARCRYYGTDGRFFDSTRDVYRLCFAGGRLVSLDLIPGDGPRR
jgi:signal transduction histidine kinase